MYSQQFQKQLKMKNQKNESHPPPPPPVLEKGIYKGKVLLEVAILEAFLLDLKNKFDSLEKRVKDIEEKDKLQIAWNNMMGTKILQAEKTLKGTY